MTAPSSLRTTPSVEGFRARRSPRLDRTGHLVFDSRFAGPTDQTYRAYLFPWTGHPPGRPAIATSRAANGHLTAYASWNGATRVARWQLLAGPYPHQLTPAASTARNGFETTVHAQTNEPFVAVRALDARGKTLGISKPIRPNHTG